MSAEPTHLDPTLSPSERADLLLRQMTLREKAHQLVSVPPWYLVLADGTVPAERSDWLEKAPGHISNFGVDDPQTMARIVGDLQRTAIEGTRLGIPLLLHIEALNGLLAGGHMVFPTSIGLAATWSPELVQEMAETIRHQMLRVGVRQALSPNMDIALDPRWGRVHETYGEDPYLAAALSVAYTRGLQGDDLRAGAIVISSSGGPFGPAAVADVLFGIVNPSGKLPYSIPRHSGQIPVYHHQRAGTGYRNPLPPDVDRHYLDMPATPQYTFGHGLSYTEFSLSDLTADSTMTTSGSVRIAATVRNTGDRAGSAIVQLYARVNTAGATRPAQQLAGFARVTLDAGAASRVAFTLAAAQLGYTDLRGEFVVEPSVVDAWLSFDAESRPLGATVVVTGPRRPLKSSERVFLSEAMTTQEESTR